MPPKKKVAASSSSSSSSSEDNKPIAIDPVVASFGPSLPQEGARFGPLLMDGPGKKEDGQGTDVEPVAEDSVSQALDKGEEKGREQGGKSKDKGRADGKDEGKSKGKGKDNVKDDDKGSMGTTRDYPLGRNFDRDNAYWDCFVDTSINNLVEAARNSMLKAWDKGHGKGNDKGFGKGQDTAWDRAWYKGYQARKLEETMSHRKGPYDRSDGGP